MVVNARDARVRRVAPGPSGSFRPASQRDSPKIRRATGPPVLARRAVVGKSEHEWYTVIGRNAPGL